MNNIIVYGLGSVGIIGLITYIFSTFNMSSLDKIKTKIFKDQFDKNNNDINDNIHNTQKDIEKQYNDLLVKDKETKQKIKETFKEINTALEDIQNISNSSNNTKIDLKSKTDKINQLWENI
jgi:peptidoglycan hydrolase CwlO-like protein